MSQKVESRKRQRRADRGIDLVFQEDHATLLADLSVNYKRSCKPDSLVPSQDCSLFGVLGNDSSASVNEDASNACEGIIGVSDLDVELSHNSINNIERSEHCDQLFSSSDNSDSDEEYCKEYFDYGVSEGDLAKFDFPVQLVNHQLDQSDIVSPDVWRIITGEKEKPNSEEILKTKLAEWALKYKTVPRTAVDSLLHMLSDHGHPTLPLCSKTLLKTPRSVDKLIRIVAGGQFWYRGIFEGLLSVITEEYLKSVKNDEIEMDVFVDGISPYKSVKRHLWPLAGCLVNHKKPFVIAIWCGPTKDPLSVDEFLNDFIEEFKRMREGFSLKNRNLKLKIRHFIADAPARAWVRKVNVHGSYYCCERCTVRGEWKFSRMTYNPNVEATLRTNESFADQTQPMYHNGISTLLSIGTSMISQFPLDIMHLLDLGSTKRLIGLLMKKKGSKFKLPPENVCRLDKLCDFLYHFTPSEFARKPRPLSQWSLYKAVEFRRILLYDGLLIFKQQKHKEVYNCFLLLSCAMRIFLDPDLRERYAKDAHELLLTFVSYSYEVLGASFVVYNIHHLTHLFSDIILHGDPNSFSCYKYENELGQIKGYLLAPGRTLQQIMCRMIEKSLSASAVSAPVTNKNRLSHHHRGGPVLDNVGKQYRMIDLGNFIIRCDNANSCVLTSSGKVVIIFNIIETESEVYCIGRKFLNKCNYFDYPFESSLLNIFLVSQLGCMEKFSLDNIKRKVVLLPSHETGNKFVDWETVPGVCIPMLHDNI